MNSYECEVQEIIGTQMNIEELGNWDMREGQQASVSSLPLLAGKVGR